VWRVSRDGVVEQRAQCRVVTARGNTFERANAQVARRHARQHRARQHGFAMDRLTGRDHRQSARGRDAECIHRLTDDHLAQHGAERRAPIAAA
jgi:hypothetical protein